MKRWLAISSVAALASCGGESTISTPTNQLTSNGFESVAGWMGGTPVPSLTKEKAHSGSYSVSVRPGVEYSMGYNNTLGNLSSSRPGKIKLKGWVLLPSAQAGGQLVTELDEPSKQPNNILWKSIDFKKEIKKYNEWQEVEQVIEVPPAATANTVLKVYLWAAGTPQPVFLDDVTLTLDDAK